MITLQQLLQKSKMNNNRQVKMKTRTFLLIIVAACCLVACRKSENIAPNLNGKWELRSYRGGYQGVDSTLAAGNGTIYQFNNDHTYNFFYKGALNAQGTYQYKKNGYTDGGTTTYDEIVFDNTGGVMVVLNGNNLTIGNTWADGLAYNYQKISN
jgi:hypothetical protein